MWCCTRLRDILQKARNCGRVSLAMVYFSFLLDGFLLTVVVPILPDYLYQLELAEDKEKLRLYCSLNSTLCQKGNNSYILPQDIINENSKVGWLFSSKAIVQLFCNAMVGVWVNRIGYTVPLFTGVLALTVSALGFALSESYAFLFASRAIHGLGAACILISGMGLLADTYPEDKDRSKAMGIALGGQAMGVLGGYPAGGVLYQFVGKTAPFMLCAVFLVINAGLQLVFMQPNCRNVAKVNGTPLHTLLMDPYILVAAGALTLPEMAMAMLEPTLPIWLADNMHLEKWQVGMIFIPDSIGFVLGTSAFGFASYKIGRWICSIGSLLLVGICLMLIPCATKMPHLIIPHFGLGFGVGVIDVSIMPLLALLVDERHVAVYGSVYAIAQFSISLGFAIGPSVGGQLVKTIGFAWLLRGMAICNLLYCPMCYFLRNPPMHRETKSILMDSNGTTPRRRSSAKRASVVSSAGNFGYQQFD